MGRVQRPVTPCLRVRADRHEDHAKALLGDTAAIVTSDRWWASSHLPIGRRQVCWAHLQRDFKAHAEGLAAEQPPARRPCGSATSCSGRGRSTSTPATARSYVGASCALRRAFKPILRTYAGKQARYRHTRGIARNLLKVWPALWTFAEHRGIEPTNNHAERALRGAVIYRKLSLGTQSQDGERRIERLLSVHTTCRLQRLPLHDYLVNALAAASRGDPVPLLA